MSFVSEFQNTWDFGKCTTKSISPGKVYFTGQSLFYRAKSILPGKVYFTGQSLFHRAKSVLYPGSNY